MEPMEPIARMQPIIRDAAEGDLPAIVAIYNATVPGWMVTADMQPVTVAARRVWFADHSPNRRPLWVLLLDGQVAGWLSFQSFYGRPAYDATAELSLYVADAHRRRGLGRLLLGRAIRQAPQLGLRNLLGFIFSHNAPSLRLFESFGFQLWGQLPNVAVLDGVERSLSILGLRVAGQARDEGR
jgi:L-amino acid N-acyltransferase YncA